MDALSSFASSNRSASIYAGAWAGSIWEILICAWLVRLRHNPGNGPGTTAACMPAATHPAGSSLLFAGYGFLLGMMDEQDGAVGRTDDSLGDAAEDDAAPATAAMSADNDDPGIPGSCRIDDGLGDGASETLYGFRLCLDPGVSRGCSGGGQDLAGGGKQGPFDGGFVGAFTGEGGGRYIDDSHNANGRARHMVCEPDGFGERCVGCLGTVNCNENALVHKPPPLWWSGTAAMLCLLSMIAAEVGQ